MDMKYVIGIDVGGTSVKCGIFTTEGELKDKFEVPTRTGDGGSHILSDAAEAVHSRLKKEGIPLEAVAGTGVIVPGPVKPDGTVMEAVNLNWKEPFDLKKRAEETFKTPAAVGNDADAAALGEHWAGAGKGIGNIMIVTLGTGIGGGVIVDGKILYGAHGCGAEIGHMVVCEDSDAKCNCGHYGCLEQWGSARGICRIASKKLAETDKDSCLRGKGFTAKDVLDAWKAGDELAGETVDEAMNVLGRGIAIAAAVIDPELILLGGGVMKAGEPLLEKIREEYRKYAFSRSADTPVMAAVLGNDAGIYGAAKLILNERA